MANRRWPRPTLPLDSDAATIRPSVSDQIRQSSNLVGIGRPGLGDEAEYAAHERACHDLSWY